ncbi:MAG: hypothetical protein ACI4E1_12600 [Lachnospira sp.]
MKKSVDNGDLTENIDSGVVEELKDSLRGELKDELKKELKEELVKSFTSNMKKEVKNKLEGTIKPDLIIFKNEILSLKEQINKLQEEIGMLKAASDDDNDILELELIDDTEELELQDETEELELEVVDDKKEFAELFMDYAETFASDSAIDVDKLKEEISDSLSVALTETVTAKISKELTTKLTKDITAKLSKQLSSEASDKINDAVREEVERVVLEKLEQLKDEVMSQLETELTGKLTESLTTDITQEIEGKVKDAVGPEVDNVVTDKLAKQEELILAKITEELETSKPEFDVEQIKNDVISAIEMDKVRLTNQQDEDNNVLQEAIYDIKTQVNELKNKLSGNISDLQFVIDTKPEMDDVLQLVNNVLDDRVKTEVDNAVSVAVSEAVDGQMAAMALKQPIPVVDEATDSDEQDTKVTDDIKQDIVTETVNEDNAEETPEIKEGDIVVYRQTPRKEFNNFGIWIVKGVNITGNKYVDAIDLYPFDQNSVASVKTVRLDEFKRLFEKMEFKNYLSPEEKRVEAAKLAEEEKKRQEEIRRRELAHEKNPVGRMITGLK